MQRFKNILASVDTRREDPPALRWAAALAEYNQARLKLVDVVPPISWPLRVTLHDYEGTIRQQQEEKQGLLDALAAPLRERGIQVTTKVLTGKTSFSIIQEVLRAQHDLVIRVTRGIHSRRPGFFGTTSRRLLRKCPCPAWLVRPDTTPQFARVLAPVEPVPHDEDHAQLNQTIMDLARSIAHYQEGEYHVVHAWELFGASALQSRMRPEEFRDLEETTRTEVARAFDDFLAPYKLTLQSDNVHLLEGEPTRVIPDLIEKLNVDLIVMGTIARGGVPGMIMGNTAEIVLDRIECAVLAIKPPGFISPVPRGAGP